MDYLNALFGCGKATPPTIMPKIEPLATLCDAIKAHKGSDTIDLDRFSTDLKASWDVKKGKGGISRSLLAQVNAAVQALDTLYGTRPKPESLLTLTRSLQATIRADTARMAISSPLPPPPTSPPVPSPDQGAKAASLDAIKGSFRKARHLADDVRTNGCISERHLKEYENCLGQVNHIRRSFGEPLSLELSLALFPLIETLNTVIPTEISLTLPPSNLPITTREDLISQATRTLAATLTLALAFYQRANYRDRQWLAIFVINYLNNEKYEVMLRDISTVLHTLKQEIDVIKTLCPTEDLTPRTIAIRKQLAHITSQMKELSQDYNTLPGCKESLGRSFQTVQKEIYQMEVDLTTIESHHIMVLATKVTVSKYSQFDLPYVNGAAKFSCGFIAAYTIYRELMEGSVDELETSMYLGLARAQAVSSDALVPIDVIEDAFQGVLLHSGEDRYVRLQAGLEIEQYRGLLETLRGGTIIRKGGAYYTIVRKEGKFIISDSHGFSEHLSDPKYLINKAFRCEFDDILSAAKFLYLRNPYTESPNHEADSQNNQCEIYPFSLTPELDMEKIGADKNISLRLSRK